MAGTTFEQRLREIRGGAKERSPNVRTLAEFSTHGDCGLASLMFAARVSPDHLLGGTKYAANFGQAASAHRRGIRFEHQIARDNYAPTLGLLRSEMGFQVADAKVIALRDAYPKNKQGLVLRAAETRRLLQQIVRRAKEAPNLVDDAVLRTVIGGLDAFFEADAIAASFDGPIYVGEVKSFPVVDGKADAEKLAAALDQVSIYIYLAQLLLEQLGTDAGKLVSTSAMLITPKNVGLTPTLSVQDVSRRVDRARQLLERVPKASELVASAPGRLSFGPVADVNRAENERIDALHELAESVGTTYKPDCMSTCGNARFCRARAVDVGSPCIVGPQLVRLTPGVSTLGRAADLARGAPPRPEEEPAARQLARAGRLYDALGGGSR